MREGWKVADLAACVAQIRSGRSVNASDEPATESEPGVLKTSCVYRGKFDIRENKAIIPSEHSLAKCPVTAGTIVVSRMNTADLVGASGYVEKDSPNIFLPDRLWAVVPRKDVDPRWLFYVISSPEVRARLSENASGTSASMKNISQDVFLSMPTRVPPLPEQRKIAEILRTWDEALEMLTALRAAKERRLSALRAALLFGRLRLGGLGHKWVPTRLDAVTHELTKRNGVKGLGRDFVMGITKAEGVVPMREQTIAGDISRYKRLPPRAFAYNPMRINVGSIAMNERGGEVLVSPDYVVFACNPDGLDPDYLDHLRKTSWWGHYINSGGSGSVRQRTYYDDLAALKLPLPALDEQKAIAAVLNTARDDLAATEREIEALTRQKRGLMQKLLTGEWRVALSRDKEH
ncbi:hypothetical protein LPB142_17885 (plasmid) [Rhodobacter xanthinilyticus]|uniref:Type I restriction modification DNA specificity domain-containing protein n=1 Tax=Rhodobacter xanthinilyticus TaxID=1850250 RepID=A0A1D9MHH4_9RHOB|nr:restriction endonuclease subunit S [Rhodobacter xanthinilyticus]AOZ71322.1 hypothetical protein LPB142_17885 [Rhodobacter xanthinilyticus]